MSYRALPYRPTETAKRPETDQRERRRTFEVVPVSLVPVVGDGNPFADRAQRDRQYIRASLPAARRLSPLPEEPT